MDNPEEPKKPEPPPTLIIGDDGAPIEDPSEPPAEQSPPADPPPPSKPAAQPTVVIGETELPPQKPQSQPTVVMGDTPAPSETTPPAAGEADEEDSLVGTVLRDKWRVLAKLGAGSFGSVYKVEDLKGGWVEALKILGVDRLTGADAENMRKRFLREAQIMKRLGTESQHIVGLSTYEEDLEAGLIYFLMELVDGKSLGDVLFEEGAFSMERTVEVALQACEALMVAHEGPEPVVHRDLKLENLMMTKDRGGNDVVKVLDFGIAKIAERETDSRLTTVGTLGTPGYAAPEQLRAEDVDGRTDLFAFGVILYGLLTNRDPWLGNRAGESTDKIYELMVATERGDVIPMSETGVEVPPAMESIVMRLLRRDPAQRFQSARELKQTLQRLSRGEAAADEGSLRVVTDEPGVEVEVRSGRKVVASGPTPCSADGLAAGTYRVSVTDGRYEPTSTTVTLGPGALEDVTLVTTARSGGFGATLKRRPKTIAAAAVVLLAGAGAGIAQPWGRTLALQDVLDRATVGSVRAAWLTTDGAIEGLLATVGFIPSPFRAALPASQKLSTVESLRAAGVEVDTSVEVSRLVGMAAAAQARMRYFGGDDDVRAYAEQAIAFDPESADAGALLRKVAERMAWDADAARADGSTDRARELIDQCLDLVPGYPSCAAMAGGTGG